MTQCTLFLWLKINTNVDISFLAKFDPKFMEGRMWNEVNAYGPSLDEDNLEKINGELCDQLKTDEWMENAVWLGILRE